jgi:hypothetical protein
MRINRVKKGTLMMSKQSAPALMMNDETNSSSQWEFQELWERGCSAISVYISCISIEESSENLPLKPSKLQLLLEAPNLC